MEPHERVPDEPAAMSLVPGETAGLSRSLLRSAGPRLVRDILGPTLSFYATWKLSGSVVAGVAVGTAFSFTAYRYERRRGRPGAIALLVLAFVVFQAAIGIATDSAEVYLIQPAILGTINGAAWLVSVAIGRPLAAVFAGEVFPIEPEMRASEEFQSAFRHVSLVFGAFFVGFALIQLAVLELVGVDAFVAVRVLDAIGILMLIVYAVRYTVGRLGSMFEVIPTGE